MALIFTTKGDIEESLLTKTEGNSENETEIVSWQEWVLDGEIVKLSQFLKQHPLEHKDSLVLQAGIPQLLAFVPVNNFLYYNAHNSHPAATFSKREDYIDAFGYLKKSEDLQALVLTTPYGAIGRFIFFKNAGSENYYLYYNVDNFPHGGISNVLTVPQKLFVEPHFKKVYENNKFIVFDTGAL